MIPDLEQELRAALRPADPPPEFTDRLLARLGSAAHVVATDRRPWFRPLAMAASVLLASSLGWQLYQHQQKEHAHAQLLEALTITSRSLDRAYHAVRSHGTSAAEHSQ